MKKEIAEKMKVQFEVAEDYLAKANTAKNATFKYYYLECLTRIASEMLADIETEVDETLLTTMKTDPSEISSEDGYTYVVDEFKATVMFAYTMIKGLKGKNGSVEQVNLDSAKEILLNTTLEKYLADGIAVKEVSFYMGLLDEYYTDVEQYEKTADLKTKLQIKEQLLEKMEPYFDKRLIFKNKYVEKMGLKIVNRGRV